MERYKDSNFRLREKGEGRRDIKSVSSKRVRDREREMLYEVVIERECEEAI